MANINTEQAIEIVMRVLEKIYGNLGFLAFRMHSIKPNHKDGVFIVKYSFIPREDNKTRLFYESRIDIKGRNLLEAKEISEPDLAKD